MVKKIVLLLLPFLFFACDRLVSKRQVDNHLEEFVYEGIISFHQFGRPQKYLEYDGKRIGKKVELYSYFDSKKKIIMMVEVKYGWFRYEIYDTGARKKTVFPYVLKDPSPFVKEASLNNGIVSFDNTKLYLKERLYELTEVYGDHYYFDYLLIQIDQMSKFLKRKDKKKYWKIFGNYKGRRISFKHLGPEENVNPKEYPEIGRAFLYAIPFLEKDYSHKTAFQIFKRAFEIRFRVKGNKIHFINNDEYVEFWRKKKAKKSKTN